MRILAFSSCFPSARDPIRGVFVLRRLTALAKLAEVEVVHPMGWFPVYRPSTHRPHVGEERLGGLTVNHKRFFYIPGILKRFDGRFYALGLERWTRARCEAQRPDLLDAQFEWPDAVGVSILARRLGLPYTVTLRGTINPRYQIRHFRRRLAESLRYAAAVISVSRPMADIAVELGAEPQRVHVIPNGVDAALFNIVPREQAREQAGLPVAGRLIVSVGSLNYEKGHEDVIQALSRLSPDVHLAIAGVSVDGGAYLRKLAGLAAMCNVVNRVRFVGSLSQEAVAMLLNAADVSVLASHREGCPNVVLESLACGTPVVATSVGAVPDFVKTDGNGFVVPAKNTVALSEALASALARPWSREAVRQSVADRSWDKVAAEVLSVFESVLAGEW
ncbi:MAG: glycosyltransferase [Candidatus Hydrogenedentes bacterium]|nr:glycosyltransferase [Candidatus Hydrogenedentota bacterium]